MHHHLEIVLPAMPPKELEEAIATILKPFSENDVDEDGNPNSHTFWDWYQIGGRWGGTKIKAGLDEKKIEEFYAWLNSENITVSGFQAGKQELAPASNIPKVDAKWCEMFPESRLSVCPLFAHSNQNDDQMLGDVMRLGDVPKNLTCARLIIAAPAHESGEYKWEIAAGLMLEDSFWNGVSINKAKWQGSFFEGIEMRIRELERAEENYKKKMTPTDDWFVVTVDYHS